jgi:hypothetical protein
LGEKTKASTGRWVFRNRRWVWASISGSLTSRGGTRKSTQGPIAAVEMHSAPSKINWLTICCIQVVPDLA